MVKKEHKKKKLRFRAALVKGRRRCLLSSRDSAKRLGVYCNRIPSLPVRRKKAVCVVVTGAVVTKSRANQCVRRLRATRPS